MRRVREWIARRQRSGVFGNLLMELRSEAPAEHKSFVRMSAADFDFFLSRNPLIWKKDALKIYFISEETAITLRYLATGDSFHSLMCLFSAPVCSISQIISEVCTTIFSNLKNEYLQVPPG